MVDLENKNWIYWLNPTDSALFDGGNIVAYRVCIVVENEAGFIPSGSESSEPWYWTQEVCDEKNRKRGIDVKTEFKILDSSMGL